MTREEQIKKQADTYTDDASNYAEWSDDGGWSETNDIELIEKAFEEGAKWADSHPNLSEEEQVGMGELGMLWEKKALIDKACEWLVDNARNYIVSNGGGYWYDSVKLKHAFKRAMEETKWKK